MSRRIQVAAVAVVAGAVLAACAPMQAGPGGPEAGGAGGSGAPKVCRAENYQRFIGRHRSTLPQTPADESWRLACSTCAVTMDFRADRLTIVYDVRTELIQSARCG
jgi:hypothetical protein